jgi:hypothetical protein
VGLLVQFLAVVLVQLAYLPVEIAFAIILHCLGGGDLANLVFESVVNSFLASFETVFPIAPDQDKLDQDEGNEIPVAATSVVTQP